MDEIVIEGQAPPEAESTYRHLPFEVPPGTGRLEVSYEYEPAAEPPPGSELVIDIGIFDRRGIGFQSEGFRGWSGSSRREFFIATDRATPGYLAGPIEPGTWYICLGFYRVPPTGCRYRVTVKLYPHPSANQHPHESPRILSTYAPSALRPRPDGWYRGDLHCHSHHSDGDSSPAELIELAEELGLDFLAITDHNTIGQLYDSQSLTTHNLILIPGLEVSTYRGHWNVWGVRGWVDFRTSDPDLMARSIGYARSKGYLASCNHPKRFGPQWEFEDVTNYSCVEVWNGPWQLFNPEALEFWEGLLRKGRHLTAVGGSDTHFLKREHFAHLGNPTTWIYHPDGTPNAAGLLSALQAGHVFVSYSPEGPRLDFRVGDAMMGDAVEPSGDGAIAAYVRVIGGDGLRVEVYDALGLRWSAPVEGEDVIFRPEFYEAKLYIRAQLVEPGTAPPQVRALSNPIYIHTGNVHAGSAVDGTV